MAEAFATVIGPLKSKRDGNFLNYGLTEKGKKVLKDVTAIQVRALNDGNR